MSNVLSVPAEKYPMKMLPAYKDYLWGGERLIADYNKSGDIRPMAESWEVSCHPDGLSYIQNGVYKGCSLSDVLSAHPGFMGGARSGNDFPILIKLIDAYKDLSLQVHPDDVYAMEIEKQQGKNEMWYVLEAKPDAALILGFKNQISESELRRRIADNTLLECVNRVPIKAGDCFCIPAGMLHAIGAGALIVEVQQNSNITYRVYDYGRLDANGNERELHINSAVNVIDSSIKAENCSQNRCKNLSGYKSFQLTDWKYFSSSCLVIDTHADLFISPENFSCIICAEGSPSLIWNDGEITLNKGESCFLPAGMGEYSIKGSCKLITAEA